HQDGIERLPASAAFLELVRCEHHRLDLGAKKQLFFEVPTVGDPTRALTARHPIKLTSPRCHSAWQPNRGRRSTYRRGKTVQTTETTSEPVGVSYTSNAIQPPRIEMTSKPRPV